jgi:hypothetical protein
VAAAIHAPLRAGDYLTTGPNSRADIEFDSTDTFRIGGNAEIHFMPPDSGKYQVELIKGDITYSAAGPAVPVVAVDTPSVSVRPADIGAYRIAVNAARESEITVIEGYVEIFAASGSEWIGAGQKMMVRGSASDPEFRVVRAISKWRRAARVLLSSMQLGVSASSSSSEEDRQSYSKEHGAPKPASKTTPIAAGNGSGNAKPTPVRGSFSGASSGQSNASNHGDTTSPGHAAAASPSHSSSTHTASTASTQAASTSSSHTAAAVSSDHSSSSTGSRSR